MPSTNALDGLITQGFKDEFANAMNELIRGCKVPCKLHYPTVQYVVCTNCDESNLGKGGPNPFIGGGNGTHTGTCPKCNGDKRVPVENSEVVEFIVMWDYKEFNKITSNLKASDGDAQTFCSLAFINKIRSSIFIEFETDVALISDRKYVLDGTPVPCGLGTDGYIITNWKKS